MAAYALDAVDDPEKTAIALHLVSCGECREEADRYRRAGRSLSLARERTWERMSEALTARRAQLDEVLRQLAGGASDGAQGSRPRLRVVVASDTQSFELCRRIADDERFHLVGTAAHPLDVLSVTGAQRPDMVVVALSGPYREWLDCLSEVAYWSPSTKVVVVSGLDADSVARMVGPSADAVAGPSEATRSAVPGARPAPTSSPPSQSAQPCDPATVARSGRRAAPRSIIDEAMWQMGIPSRVRR